MLSVNNNFKQNANKWKQINTINEKQNFVSGAPRHRVIHSPNKHSSENVSTENAVSRSYIDIDASDPFKVPKGSHYIDQTLPNFDKEEAEAKATVENTEQSPSDDSEEDSDGDHSAPDDDQQPDGGSEENAASNIADEIPDSVKEKINELSMDSKDGKPIEINEKDLQNMLNKDDKN